MSRLVRLLTCLALILALAPSPARAQQQTPPDLILTGGKVFTADPERPWAEDLAVRSDRIVAVGTT